ncbi:MAG: hypothetical protein P0S95_01980 [Rhabdochlamydiaceae bacterium]|nr:hypothetical protein [Candidatus Amphrikana amoebophyrae]
MAHSLDQAHAADHAYFDSIDTGPDILDHAIIGIGNGLSHLSSAINSIFKAIGDLFSTMSSGISSLATQARISIMGPNENDKAINRAAARAHFNTPVALAQHCTTQGFTRAQALEHLDDTFKSEDGRLSNMQRSQNTSALDKVYGKKSS